MQSALASELSQRHADARTEWPGVEVDFDSFAAFTLARLGRSGGDLGGLRTGELYLACACVRGDARALVLFDERFLTPLLPAIARGASTDEARETLQRVRERLLVPPRPGAPPRLAEFSGRGSLAGWLRVSAMRLLRNAHRDEATRARHERAEAEDAPPLPDPELAMIAQAHGAPFRAAFREAFLALEVEERLVLRLHFSEGLTVDRISGIIGGSRATAGRRLQAARARLRDETLRLLGERLRVSAEELESLLRAMRSHLELSLGALVSRS
jgi:RNA polymerase sigma-70 factor (ECF subfamily)